MIKIIGFLIILFSSAKIGYDYANKYKLRTDELKSLVTSFEIINNEIGFLNTTLPQAFLRACNVKNNNISNLMSYISTEINKDDKSYNICFNEFLDNQCLNLKKEDTDILDSYFNLCGTSNINDELVYIKNTISSLNFNIEKSKEDETKFAKLFRTMGVLSGVLIGIIFI